MNLLVIGIHIIVCLVLIVVILLQAGRGQGLTGASFGGGNVQSLLGTKASSFLTKATSICAILFLFTCIGLNVLEVRKSRSLYHAPQDQAPLVARLREIGVFTVVGGPLVSVVTRSTAVLVSCIRVGPRCLSSGLMRRASS